MIAKEVEELLAVAADRFAAWTCVGDFAKAEAWVEIAIAAATLSKEAADAA